MIIAMLNPALRKLALTAHVTASVGWLGAVAAFLALAVAGLHSDAAHVVRASYIAMDLTTRYVIVPLCFAALVTGLVSSLGTPWGLFRHYWVVVKLALTVIGTLLLLLHARPIESLARVAAGSVMRAGDHHQLRVQLVFDAAAALLLLIVNTTLALYKPSGLTRYGWRKQQESGEA